MHKILLPHSKLDEKALIILLDWSQWSCGIFFHTSTNGMYGIGIISWMEWRCPILFWLGFPLFFDITTLSKFDTPNMLHQSLMYIYKYILYIYVCMRIYVHTYYVHMQFRWNEVQYDIDMILRKYILPVIYLFIVKINYSRIHNWNRYIIIISK